MKIAYENKLPDPSALHLLLDGTPQANEQYDKLQGAERVVAAYDGDRLVAVGGFRTVGGAKVWSAMVHPSYKQRDLEPVMKKLVCG